MKLKVLGKKLGMTQVIEEQGRVVPVTIVEILPGQVISKRTTDTDGYEAIVAGYEDVSKDKLNNPQNGYFAKLNVGSKKHVQESRTDGAESPEVGSEIGINLLKEGSIVDVQGKTVGKGFAGTVKRHGFARGPMTHGSKNHRLPGSIGGGTDPGRVWKGKRMAGQMGNKIRTARNLPIISVDSDNNVVFIGGSIPGKKGNLLVIKVESNGN